MKGKGYLVFLNDEFYGVLENKEEYKIFKEQRNVDKYNIVKLPWNKINDMLAEGAYDIGRYSTVELFNGTIIFSHEEVGLIESVESHLSEAITDLPYIIKSCKEYVKFEEDEKQLLNIFTLTFTKLMRDEFTNGIFFTGTRRGQVDLERVLETWLEMITDDPDFD